MRIPSPRQDRFMLAQYVYPAKAGLFRIVRHGRRWRSMFDMQETGRHDSAEQALACLREAWPQARLPASLEAWRYLPQAAAMTHGKDPDDAAERWRMAG